MLMRKRWLMGLVVLVLGGLLALGTVSALAKGGALGGPGHETSADDNGDDEAADTDDAGDDDQGEAAAEEDDGEPGQGAQAVAQVIADEFGATPEEVLALHEQGIGFGALFKLYAIAAAKGMTVDELLATIGTDADGEFEFAFGEMKKSLTDEELAALEGGAKNLGQLVSASHKAENAPEAGEESEPSAEEASHGNGHGPPAFAKAHGRH